MPLPPALTLKPEVCKVKPVFSTQEEELEKIIKKELVDEKSAIEADGCICELSKWD